MMRRYLREAHDPDYVLEPIHPEYILLEDDHEFPAEEQPLPHVDSPTAESPRYVTESDPEEDPEEYEDDETEDGPTQREARIENEFSNLTMQLVQSIDERRSFIQELEHLPGNLEAYQMREELKGLQKDDLIKAMETRKVILQFRLQIHKEVDFYKTL
ncbi:hypothetical protein Tco_0664711 [Tanacetum coccineum]